MERFIYDPNGGKDGKGAIVHKRTFDIDTSLAQAKALRDAGAGDSRIVSDSKLAARIPMWLITEWLKEAGLKWDDPAAKDVIVRKVQSGEHQKLRVWTGRF